MYFQNLLGAFQKLQVDNPGPSPKSLLKTYKENVYLNVVC